jgi:hypothetical protein
MMMLVLAPKPMEGIEEKLLILWDKKSSQKYLQKSQKWKISQLKIRDDLTQTHRCIDVNQEFKPAKHPATIWKIGEISHFSHLFSKTWSTPTPGEMNT